MSWSEHGSNEMVKSFAAQNVLEHDKTPEFEDKNT